MLDAFQAGEVTRRATMGALGARAMEGLHGHRDEAASTLEAARNAARGAISGIYDRLRGPRTLDDAEAMDSKIEAPRRPERGKGVRRIVLKIYSLSHCEGQLNNIS